MSRDWRRAGAFFAAFVITTPAVAQDTTCQAIEKIVAAGEKRFASFKGRYDRGLLEYESRYTMPGVEYCAIEEEAEDSFGEFTCSWEFGAMSQAQVKEQELLADVNACIAGNERKVSKYQVKGRYGVSENTEIEFGYLQPKINITRRAHREMAYVSLTVKIDFVE